MPEEIQIRRETCRREVLAFLADRPAVAHHPGAIRRRLNTVEQADYTLEEIEAALVFLVSQGFSSTERDALGATKYYQVTGAGTLHHERGAA